jgi:hypothetical protein
MLKQRCFGHKICLILIFYLLIYRCFSQNDYLNKEIAHFRNIIEVYEDSLFKYKTDSIESVYLHKSNNLDSLEKYRNVQYLDIESKKIYFDSTINYLKRIKFIEISTQEISYSDNILPLDSLEIFQIPFYVKRGLKEIPYFIFNKNLKFIIGAFKNSKKIKSENFSRSPNLIRLFFVFDRIKFLPDFIYGLEKLNSLWVINNRGKIIELSDKILQLKNLINLSIPIELNDENINILKEMKQLNSLIVDKIKLKDYSKLKKLAFLHYFYSDDLNEKSKIIVKQYLPNTEIEDKFADENKIK